MYRKIISLFLVMILTMVAIMGCAKGPDGKSYPWKLKDNELQIYDKGDIALEIDTNTLTPSGCTYLFINDSERKIMYGQSYYVQIKIDGEWYSIDKRWDVTAEAYEIEPESETMIEREWNDKYAYGELPAGTYRLVQDFSFSDQIPDAEMLYAACEFEIVE